MGYIENQRDARSIITIKAKRADPRGRRSLARKGVT